MKFSFSVITIFALVATIMASKNEMCDEEFARKGNGFIACTAYIPSHSYNPTTKACESFVYGGCGGNKNRFPSKKDCEDACVE